MRLYLDVCCSKRPFDDQTQPRVRLETEAALGLLADDLAELMAGGLRGFDALRPACAEAAGADVFVTCDDRLLAAARRQEAGLKVRVGS